MSIPSILNRRNLLKNMGLGFTLCGANSALMGSGSYQNGNQKQEDHFFLKVFFFGGWDTTYLTDARPFAFTGANLLQNYQDTSQQPIPFTGKNGRTTLIAHSAKELLPLLNDFSIINGMNVSSSDGHEQNLNAMITGNPFGGEGFLPLLNQGQGLLDYVTTPGRLFGVNVTNGQRSLVLAPSTAKQLVESAQALSGGQDFNAAKSFSKRRMNQLGNATPEGMFSSGSREMLQALIASNDFKNQLSSANFELDNENQIKSQINMLSSYFKAGLCKSGLIFEFSGDMNLDTHDANSCKNYPNYARAIVGKINQTIQALKDTPYNAKESMFDRTTVMIFSEFSRTMRQEGVAIDATGTDHNGLCNTVFLGGRGIVPGLVLGESDFDSLTPEGNIANISEVHRKLDPPLLRMMGKAYDPVEDRCYLVGGSDYNPIEYITPIHLINTVYKLFGVKEELYRGFGREGEQKAPILEKLLNLG